MSTLVRVALIVIAVAIAFTAVVLFLNMPA
jgi:hypothetical protein